MKTLDRTAQLGRWWMTALAWALAALVFACGSSSLNDGENVETASPPGGTKKVPAPAGDSFHPAAKRIVAVGDLHGDVDAAREALVLGGLIDEPGRWIGGDTVLVQTGDVLDRGNQEREIVELLERLEVEARAAGGAVHALLGNHELMNVAGDYKYTPQENLDAFPMCADGPSTSALEAFPENQRARASSFLPGGCVTRKLADHDVAVVIGDTAFVHAGLLPEHVFYGLDRINTEVRDWLSGSRPNAPAFLADRHRSPVWTRLYSMEPVPPAQACETLDHTLDLLGAKRLVVGHTVQEGGISPACGEKVWRIDVGMSAAYKGAPVEVLEITGDRVTPLARNDAPLAPRRETGAPQ